MRRWAALAAVVVVATTTACVRDVDEPSAVGTEIKPIQLAGIPAEIEGLRVQAEDVGSALGEVRRSYVKGVALYSLRNDKDVVQATLQVTEFQPGDRYVAPSFRRTIVNQLGSSAPRTTRMGDDVVYRTTGTKQTVGVWFHGHRMFLLSIRDEFDRPRTLLREFVGMKQ